MSDVINAQGKINAKSVINLKAFYRLLKNNQPFNAYVSNIIIKTTKIRNVLYAPKQLQVALIVQVTRIARNVTLKGISFKQKIICVIAQTLTIHK